MKGTAAKILHHLLLTNRRGMSPIRLWEVKLLALRSFEADGQFIWRRAGTQLSSAAVATGLFFAHSVKLQLDPARLRSLDDCSFLPSFQLRVHPSAQPFLGVRLLNVERGKTSTSDRGICLQRVKQRHPVLNSRAASNEASLTCNRPGSYC